MAALSRRNFLLGTSAVVAVAAMPAVVAEPEWEWFLVAPPPEQAYRLVFKAAMAPDFSTENLRYESRERRSNSLHQYYGTHGL